jgi:hypothetical protein
MGRTRFRPGEGHYASKPTGDDPPTARNPIPLRRIVPATVLSLLAVSGIAHAAGLNLSPNDGPPGTEAVASIDCEMSPEFKSRWLAPGAPPGTLMGYAGEETSAGTWTTVIEVGAWDVVVNSACDDRAETARFDVDNPQLAPGPSWAHIGAWRPELDGTTVIGTDCPAGTTARVEFSVAGRNVDVREAEIDAFGDWEVPVPAVEGKPELTVSASCGDLRYPTITVPSLTPATPEPPVTEPGQPDTDPPARPQAPPATPRPARPSYTG